MKKISIFFVFLIALFASIKADAQTQLHITTWAFEVDYADGTEVIDDNPNLSTSVTTYDNFPWVCMRQPLTTTKDDDLAAGFYCLNTGHGWLAAVAFCNQKVIDEDEEKVILGGVKGETIILKATCKTYVQ